MTAAPAQLDIRGISAPRLDEYFGVWAMDVPRFNVLFDRARSLDLRAHVAEPRTPRERPTQIVSRSTPAVARAGRGDTVGPGSTVSQSVAVVTIAGTLMKQSSSLDDSTSSVEARRQIRAAANDPTIGGILIVIDSPGGTVSGTADLADDVAAAAKMKPVYALIEDFGASAAYWIASQAEKVFANTNTALVGSIGTYMGLYDLSGAAEKEGIKAMVFKTGALKGAGFPGAPITEEQAQNFQNIVDNIQTHFDSAVKSARGFTNDQLAKVRTGGVFLAGDALQRGLIDGIQSQDTTVSQLFERIQQNQEKRSMSDPITAPKADDTTEKPAPVPEKKDAETEEKPADPSKPAASTPPPPANTRSEGKKFTEAFGVENGSRWFAEGKSFDEARDLHAADLTAKNVDLQKRLNAVDRGEKAPVGFMAVSETVNGKTSGPNEAVRSKVAATHGDAIARIAAGVKLPKQ